MTKAPSNKSDIYTHFGAFCSRAWLYYALMLVVGILVLIPRLDGLEYLPGKYLWAEDGNIFLNEAQSLGLPAIVKPYAGYLHFYPRVIPLISTHFALIFRPLFYVSGWTLAWLIMIFTIAHTAKTLSLSWLSSIALICIVSLQPQHNELFFNLTNSQWLLGTALMLLCIIDSDKVSHKKILTAILISPLVLTGPFSIVLCVILFIKAVLLKDWSFNKPIYISVLLGAIVQTFVLLKSGRPTTGHISNAPWDWIIPFLQLILFSAKDILSICGAVFFWSVAILVIKKRSMKIKREIELALLLVCAAFLLLASLYSSKDNPTHIVFLGICNRYTWISYTLIFTAMLSLSVDYKFAHIALIGIAVFLCLINFHSVKLPYLQFKSFARFSRVKTVVIPINPAWPIYPGWHIIGKRSNKSLVPEFKTVPFDKESVVASSLYIHSNGNCLNLESTGHDPILVFKKPIFCATAKDFGVEIDITRNVEGWMQLFWSDHQSFNESNSLRRWYPSGRINAQFAFPNKGGDSIYIRFDPMEIAGSTEIHHVKVYCLPEDG